MRARVLEGPATAWTNMIELDGQIVGGWSRSVGRGGAVRVGVTWFVDVGESGRRRVAAAAKRYGDFLGRPVTLDVLAKAH